MKSMGGGAFIDDVSQRFYVVLYSENHFNKSLRKDLLGKKERRNTYLYRLGDWKHCGPWLGEC